MSSGNTAQKATASVTNLQTVLTQKDTIVLLTKFVFEIKAEFLYFTWRYSI